MTAGSPDNATDSPTDRHTVPVSAGEPPGKRPRHQGMDHLCKLAMERDHGRLLGMIFTPALCDRLRLPSGTPRLLDVLPTELARRRLQADYLIKVDLGGRVLLAHLEFQNRPDPKMGERVLQYQVAACVRHGLPIYSIVFNVHARDEQPVRVRELLYGSLKTEWIEVTVPAAARA